MNDFGDFTKSAPTGPSTGPFAQSTPPDAFTAGGPRTTSPWLGLVDILVGWVVPFLGAAFLGLIVLIATGEIDIEGEATSADLDVTPTVIIFGGMLPLIVGCLGALAVQKFSLGPVRDWRIKFKPVDIPIGLGIAVFSVFVVGTVAWSLTQLVGLEEQTSNTGLLTDATGFAVVLAVFLAVIVAPITEEIMFRGMFLRIFERIGSHVGGKVVGWVTGAVVSTVVFGLLHQSDDPGWANFIVVAGSISVIGLILAIAALYFDRIGPTIWAHFFFNAWGVAAALWLGDYLEDLVESENESVEAIIRVLTLGL